MTIQLPSDDVRAFSFKVWSYKMGEQVSLLIHLGDRLGFYGAMRGAGPLNPAELADRTDTHVRFVTEWLLGQAAAGLLERTVPEGGSDDDAVYELTDVAAAVLADEDNSLSFSCGAFRGGTAPETVDAIAESFRTGIGITYEQQGPSATAGLARMTGPWSKLALTDIVLPALDGVVDKLTAGATVVDVGCGAGYMLCELAAAFPNSRCIGLDPSDTAIEMATRRAAAAGLGNVEFVVADGADLSPSTAADVVLTFDCLHDMARPDLTAAAIAAAMKPDATWLIKEIKSMGSFEQNRKNPMLAMMYGFSISSCLQSAMSTPDGLGYGTLGLHTAELTDLVRAAGFERIETHDLGDSTNLYHEVRF